MKKAKVTNADELRKNISSAYMDNIGIACVCAITNDKRMKGRKVKESDVVKMKNIIAEWESLFSHVVGDIDWPTRIFLDMFFGDYASAKKKIQFYKERQERVLERKKEELKAFNKILQKIDKKM
jgi:hypothetical protein